MTNGWLFLGYGPIAAGLIARNSTPGANTVVSDHLKFEPSGFEIDLLTSEDFSIIKKIEKTNVLISWKEITTKRQLILSKLMRSLRDDFLIINLSSSAVYGEGLLKNAYESEPKPLNQYGKLKYQSETIISEIFQNQVTHLRVSNLYGNAQFQDFITKIVVSIENGSKLLVYENGNILRDHVLIEDLLDFLNLLTQDQRYRKLTSEFPILDFATGDASNQLKLIQIVEDILNRKVANFQWETKPLDMASASSQVAAELRAFFDFKMTPVEIGLTQYLGHKFLRSS